MWWVADQEVRLEVLTTCILNQIMYLFEYNLLLLDSASKHRATGSEELQLDMESILPTILTYYPSGCH